MGIYTGSVDIARNYCWLYQITNKQTKLIMPSLKDSIFRQLFMDGEHLTQQFGAVRVLRHLKGGLYQNSNSQHLLKMKAF